MPISSPRSDVVLVDAMVIIEAVRIGVWNAITSAFTVETVQECVDETRRGPAHAAGYVPVSAGALGRLREVHPVSEEERAALTLRYGPASSMHDGERDLFAHAWAREAAGDSAWVVSSPDHASVRAAVALGLGDRMHSLEELIRRAGARPSLPMRSHHSNDWLANSRTLRLLGQ